MGLCRCRNVTNLFCYEHRKNVCEVCILSSHERCVVKSYLQWLQDSDFDSTCTLCSKSLANSPVARLLCLDVFHLECLDQYCKQKPHTTTSNGYNCPTCQIKIIPAANQTGPLATSLKQLLGNCSWALSHATATETIDTVKQPTYSSGIEPLYESKVRIDGSDPDDESYKMKRAPVVVSSWRFNTRKTLTYFVLALVMLLIIRWVTKEDIIEVYIEEKQKERLVDVLG